jgi:cytochrome P450 family 110
MMHLPVVTAPRLYQLWQWSYHPLNYLDECSQQYGDCFMGRIGIQNIAFFSHPDAIAQIFAKSQAFDTGRTDPALRLTMGEHSILVMDGERHRKRRKLIMPPFHGERMRVYGEQILQMTQQTIETWQLGQPLEMLTQMSDLTLKVMLGTVFGVMSGDRSQQIRQSLRSFLKTSTGSGTFFLGSLLSFWAKPNNPFYRRSSPVIGLLQQVDQLLFAEIHDRRTHFDPQRTDILSLLLSAQDEEGKALTDQELRDEIITLLVTGHDSTAATITWALYHIHTHRRVKARLLAELEQVSNPYDATSLVRLPYLSAVCSESLRLRSAGPTGLRRLSNDTTAILEYELPANTLLVSCNYLTHHRADLYPQPQQFRPERFLERQYDASEFYPFGGGDRYCIGAAFAQYEMKLVLANILINCELAIDQQVPIAAIRRGINIAPQGGVQMRVRQKNRSLVLT